VSKSSWSIFKDSNERKKYKRNKFPNNKMGIVNNQFVCGLAVLTAVLGACFYAVYITKEKKENYSSSSFTNVGSFVDLGAQPSSAGRQYDMMQNYGTNYNPNYPASVPWGQTNNSANEYYCGGAPVENFKREYYCGG